MNRATFLRRLLGGAAAVAASPKILEALALPQPKQKVSTFTEISGLREDLHDAIYNISPVDSPFVSMTKGQTFTEWQTDALVPR